MTGNMDRTYFNHAGPTGGEAVDSIYLTTEPNYVATGTLINEGRQIYFERNLFEVELGVGMERDQFGNPLYFVVRVRKIPFYRRSNLEKALFVRMRNETNERTFPLELPTWMLVLANNLNRTITFAFSIPDMDRVLHSDSSMGETLDCFLPGKEKIKFAMFKYLPHGEAGDIYLSNNTGWQYKTSSSYRYEIEEANNIVHRRRTSWLCSLSFENFYEGATPYVPPAVAILETHPENWEDNRTLQYYVTV